VHGARTRAPAQEARDIAFQGRARLRVRGVARGRAGLFARAACERSAQTRCPACLGAQRTPTSDFSAIASQCCLSKVRGAASANVHLQRRPARAAVLALLSERAPAPAPRSWPAAPPRPAACRPSPGSRPGARRHTLALAQAAWQAAVRHERSQRARACTWALSRASTSVPCTVPARRSASARNCSSTCLSCTKGSRSAQPLPSRLLLYTRSACLQSTPDSFAMDTSNRQSRPEDRVRRAAPRLVVQVPPHALKRPRVLRIRRRLRRRHSW